MLAFWSNFHGWLWSWFPKTQECPQRSQIRIAQTLAHFGCSPASEISACSMSSLVGLFCQFLRFVGEMDFATAYPVAALGPKFGLLLPDWQIDVARVETSASFCFEAGLQVPWQGRHFRHGTCWQQSTLHPVWPLSNDWLFLCPKLQVQSELTNLCYVARHG